MQMHAPIESDLPLEDCIQRQVRLLTTGQIHQLHVEVKPRHVILTGQASCYYAKQLATHAAMQVMDELADLTNDIEVVGVGQSHSAPIYDDLP